jgi:hydrogenase/urease accessory protein HupE
VGFVFPLSLIVCGALHPGSFSSSRIEVQGDEVRHVLRVQVLSLIESLEIDLDDDLRLSQQEWEAAREGVEGYLLGSYDLWCNQSEVPLERRIASTSLEWAGNAELPSSAWIEAEILGRHSDLIEHLRVEERLFDASEPRHIEYASVAWKDWETTDHVFSPGEPKAEFEASKVASKGPLRSFFELGWEHILTGYDHLLFLLALFVAVRGVKSLALMVTAFTLAHSLTLGAAAMDWVALPPRFVELAIALSIVYVSASNLLSLKDRRLWVEALVFGLLHGLGFAGFLGEALANESGKLVPLFGFNLGVEAGQLTLVLPLALFFYLLRRGRTLLPEDQTPATLVPSGLGRALSGLIALAGIYWFVERAF